MSRFSALLLVAAVCIFSPCNASAESKVPAARALRQDDFRPVSAASAPNFGRPFFPLGFSPSGAFAWFEEPINEECGCWFWRLTIQDLKTDAILWEDSGSSDRSPEITDRSTWLLHRGAAATEALRKHGVRLDPPVLGSLPYVPEESPMPGNHDWYTVLVDLLPPALPGGDPIARISIRRTLAAKEIARFPIMGGWGFASPPQVIGLFVSPFEPRVVVVLAMRVRALHGPPHQKVTRLIGAHLEEGFGLPQGS